MNTHQLDARGLKCPMPVIKLQQSLRELDSGTHVELTVTDAGAEKDVQSWCRINKHRFINCAQIDSSTWLITIQKA